MLPVVILTAADESRARLRGFGPAVKGVFRGPFPSRAFAETVARPGVCRLCANGPPA